MFKFENILLIITATSTALIAGLFYAWSCSVIPGLTRLSNAEYMSAMQSMNRAIQNPVFFICFLGTVLLLPLCTYIQYTPPASGRFWLLLAASALYLVAVFGVTIFGNVPLNNALDAFHLQSATAQEIAAQRAKFEAAWNNLNMIRTIASILAIVLVIIACIIPKNS